MIWLRKTRQEALCLLILLVCLIIVVKLDCVDLIVFKFLCLHLYIYNPNVLDDIIIPLAQNYITLKGLRRTFWWHMPLSTVLKRQRQAEFCELEANLVFILSSGIA